MPSIEEILGYWVSEPDDDLDQFLAVYEDDEPHCVGCKQEFPEWSSKYLDRAHIVNRCYGGVNEPYNLTLLCRPCNRAMPKFAADQDAEAAVWVCVRSIRAERRDRYYSTLVSALKEAREGKQTVRT